MLFAVLIAATEGVAWLSAEQFRDTIAGINERNVAERREAYEEINAWGLFDFGLRGRVDEPLFDALVAVGDRVITDHRREEPSMGRSTRGRMSRCGPSSTTSALGSPPS